MDSSYEVLYPTNPYYSEKTGIFTASEVNDKFIVDNYSPKNYKSLNIYPYSFALKGTLTVPLIF